MTLKQQSGPYPCSRQHGWAGLGHSQPLLAGIFYFARLSGVLFERRTREVDLEGSGRRCH